MVNMIGPEPHSRLDAVLVRRLGQPEWLTVSTPEEYVQAVLRLAQDDALRVAIGEAILSARPESRLQVDDDSVLEDFAEIFHAVYLHHESIRASGRKVWTYDELCRLSQEEEKPAEEAPPEFSTEEKLLMEIRDLLKEQQST